MKNLLLSVFLFVSTMPLWSQIVTEKDFQGKWKLVSYTTKDATLDVATGKATVNEASQKSLGPEFTARLIEEMEALAKDYNDDYLEFKGKKFSLFVENDIRKGSYKITRDKENNQVVVATFKDTSKSTVPINLHEGKLVIEQKYTGKLYTFEKSEE